MDRISGYDSLLRQGRPDPFSANPIDERRDVGGSSERPALDDRSTGPVRRTGGSLRRLAVAGAVAGLLALAGCSDATNAQFSRLGLPEGASDRTEPMLNLWIGTWIAAGSIGIFMWGVIIWAAVRYKTKHNEMPRQTRYNLPMEIFYTGAPFIVLGVLFYYTILAQNTVEQVVAKPEVTVDVVGQKWSWVFNYRAAENPAVKTDVYEAGTINKTPTLYLPVNKSVQFNLTSPDVIHSFWVTNFYRKMDVIPGKVNSLYLTPTREGTFRGKCTELCGTYHSTMLFNVEVVSEAEYNEYLKGLAARGNTGQARGPADANAPAPAEDQTGAQKDEDRAGESRGNE